MEKLTKDDVLKIKPGKTVAFQLDDNKAVHSGKNTVQYVKQVAMPDDIADYQTSANWEQSILTVTAIPK